MNRLLALLLIQLIGLTAYSQSERTNIYSGGMLIVQPGYTMASNNHQDIRDVSFGLGGILRFYLYQYFTAGIYGGTQRTGYISANSESSNISLGYGGPFAGYSQKFGRVRLTASAFVGMGTVRNLHIESQSGTTLSEAYLYKHSALVLSPLISVDYALTQRLLITFQSGYLAARYNRDKMLYNPTFQVGVLFNR